MTTSKKITLDIDGISDELYLLLLQEFKKQAKDNGIDWDTIEEQNWEISCNIK